MPTNAERLTALECQIERLCSDIESEKGTRVRVHDRMNAKLDLLEKRVTRHDRLVWMGMGIVAVLNLAAILVGLYTTVVAHASPGH